MKSIKIIIIIGIIVSNISCDKCYFGDPIENITNYKIINNSGKKIKFIKYVKDYLPSEELLQINDIREYHISNYNLVPDELFWDVDSIQVVFDDTISIIHKREPETGGNVKRNLLSLDSYNVIELKEGYAECEYVFTDTDYQEALEYYNSL